MIHVAYKIWGGDGFYTKMLGTSMISMFENTKEKITIHIMHNDRLTPDNRGKFCYIAGQYNQQIKFYNVEVIAEESFKKIEAVHPNMGNWTKASWYPLISHEIFPDIDKIILIGADVVFNLDVAELWNYNLDEEGNGLAAVSEYFVKGKNLINPICADGYVKHEHYFNADVLLVKPSFFRENFEIILNACKFIYDKGYIFAEQDALNYLFSEKCLQLPKKFNIGLLYLLDPRIHHLEKAIYHFNVYKPYLDTDNIYNRLYMKYFLKTPWATEDMFGNIHKSVDKLFRQVNNKLKNNFLHLINLLSRRQRAFFVDKNNKEIIKGIFQVREDELVIDNSTDDALKNLIDILNNGQKVFFIFSSNYMQIKNLLVDNKFTEGTDFINGFTLLSEQYGIRENFANYSRTLLQEM